MSNPLFIDNHQTLTLLTSGQFLWKKCWWSHLHRECQIKCVHGVSLEIERENTTHKDKASNEEFRKHLTEPQELARELASAQSIDDFYRKDGIFSRMFLDAIERMLKAELSAKLEYDR